MTQRDGSNVVQLHRRTSEGTVAYCQGYLAGLDAAERHHGNVEVLRKAMTETLEAAWRQYRGES